MENILLQLYNGELAPSTFHNDQIPIHRAKRRACLQQYQGLLQKLDALDPNLRDDLEKLVDDQLSTDMLELPEAFMEGFRMGARIMLAVCGETTD